jgi:signal transduction histidine kinase
MSDVLRELARHLMADQERLVDQWHQISQADPALISVSQVARSEFRNNIPAAIRQLCRILTAGISETPPQSLEEAVEKHGHHRWKQGFSLKQLIRDWGHLNEVLQKAINAFFRARGEAGSEHRDIALRRLSKYMTEAATSSVNRFDELRQSQAASVARDLESVKGEFARLTHARGQLLRAAAHDIKGGLSAVAVASDTMKLSSPANSAITEMLDRLDRGLDAVEQMLNGLLELSRLESGVDQAQLNRTDVGALLRDVTDRHQAYAVAAGLRLTCSGPETLEVVTDAEKIERIAQNLLINAVKYTSAGEVTLSWWLSGKRWSMRVTDTGPGIQDIVGSSLARQMNDPGNTLPSNSPSLAYAGEGIGLTIVSELCELLDAGLSLDSTPGEGSMFTIDFPCSYPSPT